MKLIIEREATFENNSDIDIKLTEKIITIICKIYTIKLDMLNSQLDLTSQSPRRSPLVVSVHA